MKIKPKDFVTVLFVIILFVVSIIVKIYFTGNDNVLFGYDQARDATIAQQIIHGDFKVQGPSANAPGLNHGVVWFYFITLGYLIGAGNPITVVVLLSIFVSLSIPLTAFLAWLITKNRKIVISVALLTAASYEITQYATWLSNPSLALVTVPIIYIGLWLWTKTNKKIIGSILAGLGLGFSIQADLFLVYHLIPLTIWLVLNKVKKQDVFKLLFAFIISCSPLIADQIMFGFKGLEGLIFLLGGKDYFVATRGLSDFIVNYFNQFGSLVSNNVLPVNTALGGLLGIITLIFLFRKARNNWVNGESFILFYSISHFTISFFGGSSTPYIAVGLGSAVIIGTAMLLSKISNYVVYGLVILLLFFIGLSYTYSNRPHGQKLFAIQKEMLLTNEKNLVDYTYRSSGGKAFSVNSVTAPLWMNVTWSYLYKWYGMKNFGYLPNYIGRDQVGQINQLQQGKPQDLIYLIVEPAIAIPQRYIDATIAEENERSKIIEEKNWGTLIVQKRILK